jgi:hypothetical protein
MAAGRVCRRPGRHRRSPLRVAAATGPAAIRDTTRTPSAHSRWPAFSRTWMLPAEEHQCSSCPSSRRIASGGLAVRVRPTLTRMRGSVARPSPLTGCWAKPYHRRPAGCCSACWAPAGCCGALCATPVAVTVRSDPQCRGPQSQHSGPKVSTPVGQSPTNCVPGRAGGSGSGSGGEDRSAAGEPPGLRVRPIWNPVYLYQVARYTAVQGSIKRYKRGTWWYKAVPKW